MRVTFLSPALQEFVRALEYLESQQPGVGVRLDEDLWSAIRLLREAPESGAPHMLATRRALLSRFPYAVIYRIMADRIVVVAFSHQRQEPGYWRDRG